MLGGAPLGLYWCAENGLKPRKFSHWSNCVAGDLGALAVLASPCPGAAILLYTWPHETLWDQLCCCFCAWVRQIVDGLEHYIGSHMEGLQPAFVQTSSRHHWTVDSASQLWQRRLLGLTRDKPKQRQSSNQGYRVQCRLYCVPRATDSSVRYQKVLRVQYHTADSIVSSEQLTPVCDIRTCYVCGDPDVITKSSRL
jgi:hypothetical protein